MTIRYDEPNVAAKTANGLFRLLAEAGVSMAGTRAIRVRGRKTGKRRGVVDQSAVRRRPRLPGVASREHAVGPKCQGGR